MKPVTISYRDLLPFSDASALHTSLLDAFGSGEGALGLLIVSDLPAEFAALREACLLKACEFARLVRRPLYACMSHATVTAGGSSRAVRR
jgi:hypothetical protein